MVKASGKQPQRTSEFDTWEQDPDVTWDCQTAIYQADLSFLQARSDDDTKAAVEQIKKARAKREEQERLQRLERRREEMMKLSVLRKDLLDRCDNILSLSSSSFEGEIRAPPILSYSFLIRRLLFGLRYIKDRLDEDRVKASFTELESTAKDLTSIEDELGHFGPPHEGRYMGQNIRFLSDEAQEEKALSALPSSGVGQWTEQLVKDLFEAGRKMKRYRVSLTKLFKAYCLLECFSLVHPISWAQNYVRAESEACRQVSTAMRGVANLQSSLCGALEDITPSSHLQTIPPEISKLMMDFYMATTSLSTFELRTVLGIDIAEGAELRIHVPDQSTVSGASSEASLRKHIARSPLNPVARTIAEPRYKVVASSLFRKDRLPLVE